jgi:hypothetical protein
MGKTGGSSRTKEIGAAIKKEKTLILHIFPYFMLAVSYKSSNFGQTKKQNERYEQEKPTNKRYNCVCSAGVHVGHSGNGRSKEEV